MTALFLSHLFFTHTHPASRSLPSSWSTVGSGRGSRGFQRYPAVLDDAPRCQQYWRLRHQVAFSQCDFFLRWCLCREFSVKHSLLIVNYCIISAFDMKSGLSTIWCKWKECALITEKCTFVWKKKMFLLWFYVDCEYWTDKTWTYFRQVQGGVSLPRPHLHTGDQVPGYSRDAANGLHVRLDLPYRGRTYDSTSFTKSK